MDGPLSSQKIEELRERQEVIDLIRYAVTSAVGDDQMHAMRLDQWRLKEYRAEQIAASIVEASREIQCQRLADDVVPVRFTRKVPVMHETRRIFTQWVPKGRWSRWKHYHPRLRRLLMLSPPKLGIVRASVATPILTAEMVEVVIDEAVTIERRMTYPHSTYVLPERTFGPPVYREIRRTSW